MKSIVRHALLLLAFGLQLLVPRVQAAVPATDAMPSTRVYANCSWNHPGVNPFMGDLEAAVDRYQDIPPEVRARLKARMAKRDYDDLVSIRRDRIDGRAGYDYDPVISEMHFGTDQLCKAVTRAAWTPAMEERGLVYCETSYCLIIPTVCRNLSRISRQGVGDTAAVVPPLLAAPVADAPPIDWFAPPGAGGPVGDALPLAGGAPLDGLVGGLPVGDVGIAPALLGGFVGAGVGAILVGGIGEHGGGSYGPGTAMSTGGMLPDITAGGSGPALAVPEPEVWTLLLLGLGALGVLMAGRSKRRHGGAAGRRAVVSPRATTAGIFQ